MKRVLIAALVALALRGLVQVAYSTYFCPPRRALEAARSGATDAVLERGERVARIGDAIFTCETEHRAGPIVLHHDLDCYCAPAIMSAEEVGNVLNGSCTIDHLAPLLTDPAGSCRFARCSHYVNP
jgi:hypothetical protein